MFCYVHDMYLYANKNSKAAKTLNRNLENIVVTEIFMYPTHKKYSIALIFAIFASWGSFKSS